MFQETLQNTGLNKYMVEMANIRNMNAWVHPHEPEKATQKAKVQVKIAVAKISQNFPLTDIKVNITPKAQIIGGGLSGLSVAKNMADQGCDTDLIEKQERLGGQTSDIEFGACIIATGAHETRPSQYLYNEDPRVMSLMPGIIFHPPCPG